MCFVCFFILALCFGFVLASSSPSNGLAPEVHLFHVGQSSLPIGLNGPVVGPISAHYATPRHSGNANWN
jgi:hypothetical protein